jgi:hypothetical protein
VELEDRINTPDGACGVGRVSFSGKGTLTEETAEGLTFSPLEGSPWRVFLSLDEDFNMSVVSPSDFPSVRQINIDTRFVRCVDRMHKTFRITESV